MDGRFRLNRGGGGRQQGHQQQQQQPQQRQAHSNIKDVSSWGCVPPKASIQGERTYTNVAAPPSTRTTRQQQNSMPLPPPPPASEASAAPTVPAIPRSQAVKQLMEPSYSTILQPDHREAVVAGRRHAAASVVHPPRPPPSPANPPPPPPPPAFHVPPLLLRQEYHSNADGAIYANVDVNSVYCYGAASNYSGNYSELEALRSSDSQGSTEEELASLSISNPGQACSGGGGGGGGGGPPSPVSSSYSELRQATRRMPPAGFVYQDGLYEPITPGARAKTVSVGATLTSPPHPGPIGRLQPAKAAASRQQRATAAANSMRVSGSDYFGPCSKCSTKIVGDGTGCTAMGRLYHVDCFACTACFCLLQGKPFYALDGKPYCEEDYLETLEKCCKCLKPILDRILRATGKPYHPRCFTCVMCGQSLDGVPFTVDAANQIHCIEDFHRRFAPRCSVCRQPIMPEQGNEETVRVVALDRSFHVRCYKCEDCGLLLSSEAEGRGCYPLDDHVLCKQCNTKRIQLLTQGMD